MYAQKQSGPRHRRAPEQRRPPARAGRAPPRLGDHLDGVAELAEASASASGVDGEELVRFATPPRCTTSARSRSPTRSSPSPARWTTTSGRSCAATRSSASASSPRRPALGAGRASSCARRHEALDGGGYPDGLAGEDIPLGARIIAVCDAFDAMISDRPYARPRPVARGARRAAPLRRHAVRPRRRRGLRAGPGRAGEEPHGHLSSELGLDPVHHRAQLLALALDLVVGLLLAHALEVLLAGAVLRDPLARERRRTGSRPGSPSSPRAWRRR